MPRIVLALLILSVPVFALSSKQQKVQNYSWGSVELTDESAGATTMKLRMTPLQPDGGRTIFSQTVFYFALAPYEKIQCTVIDFSAWPNSFRSMYRAVPSVRNDDSSSFSQSLEPVSLQELPAVPIVTVKGYGWFRGYFVARIEVTPIYTSASASVALFAQSVDVRLIKTKTTTTAPLPQVRKQDFHFETVLRELIVNYDDALPYKIPLFKDTTGNWFNGTAKYVKLAIGNDGIYRITQTQLAALVPSITTVDPKTFQIFDRGKELPVFVSGENDGSFDPIDYLEFPALRNYTGKHRIVTTSVGEEYNEYLNRYTDTTFLWLTWGESNGKRTLSNPANIPTADTLKAYTAFIHRESQGPFPGIQPSWTDIYSRQDYRWNRHDIWPWDFLNAPGTAKVNFVSTDVAQNGDSVTLYSKFASSGTNIVTAAHKVGIGVNGGGDLKTVILNGGDQTILQCKASVSSLSEGTNFISLTSYPTDANPNSIIYDWFEIEYPRQLKAVNDTLFFDFRSLPDRKLRNVQIANVQASNIIVYRVKPDAERISNYTLSGSGPYTLTFADTIGSQEQYIIFPESKAYTPVFRTVKNFLNIRSNKSQADYIAVTHSRFYPEAIQYVQNVGTSKHLTTRLFNVDDIFDEFAFGYPTSEALQAFVQSTFQWNTPAPSFLVLIGDASYDYKNVYGNKDAINFVPSIGYPVSDVAYALVDTITNYPQMYVGRIPVNNVGELTQYLSMYDSYQTAQYDDWNKRFLFFTGGDPEDPGQMALLKSTHDQIIATVAKPAPIGGITTHFYKTVNPQSDFGPYSTQEVKDAISAGGIFISYIGHSGTETWDNSISNPLQLKNSRNRYSLITDFGCSTGKFAEPQVKSFSELFVIGSSASAIAYVSNSSLGFVGIATSLPQKFYSAMLKDSIVRIGRTHLVSKLRKISQEGFTTENVIMLYNNTLIGDPTVDLKVPFVPNLSARQDLISSSNVLSDDQDSAAVKIIYNNYGSLTADSIDITIQQTFLSSIVRTWSFRRPMPLLYDTLLIYLAIKQKAGEHSVTLTLDPLNKISELTKSDNAATKTFIVLSPDFKLLNPPPMSLSSASTITLLNPETQRFDPSKIVSLEIDTLGDYSTAVKLNASMGIISTSFTISALTRPARYYWRARLQGSSANWTTGTVYVGLDTSSIIGQADSVEWQKNSFFHTVYVLGSGSRIQNTPIDIRIISAGNLDGNFGEVDINGVNKLASTFSRGHSVLIIDPVSDTVVRGGNFDLFGDPRNADSLVAFINSVPDGYLTAATIKDDGGNNVTGGVLNAYHSIGSKYIDSVGFRDSWAILGKKGASQGSALEAFKRSTTGKAIVETTFVRNEIFGTVTTPSFGPVSSWGELTIDRIVPVGARSTVSMIGISKSGNADTLFASYDSSSVNLKNIAAKKYASARLLFTLSANSSLASPVINSWKVRAQSPPELVVSQNTVSVQKSTMQEGELSTVGIKVYNVGSAQAESVSVSILTDDGGPLRTLKNLVAPSIKAGDTVSLFAQYDSRGRRGNHSFVFEVDPNNVINEFYKSNNAISVPYTVLPDTLRPSFDVTFDNIHVLDGDYVRAVPNVLFQFRDINGSPFTQNDTSSVHIELNGRQIFYTGNSTVQFVLGTAPVLAEIRWAPQLLEGENTIKYFAKDAAANSSDTTILTVKVSSKLEVHDVYNIPNPFGTGTTFSFTLTGNEGPQNAHIKIYTVAGRLIQDLDFSSRVHIGANGYQNSSDNLYWNGRDKDGSEIANGIYLYRVIISGNGQQSTATQKLVKMR